MKKIIYTFLAVSIVFAACKKEDEVITQTVLNGCTDENANNFNTNATNDDGSCIYAGCMDSNATNYNSLATIEDSSCTYPIVSGCMDSIAFNYNLLATIDDRSCDYRVTGGKWIQFSESIDVTLIVWADENQTQFIDSMSISEYESDTDSMSIQQLKFFIDGNIKTYDTQATVTHEGTWTEYQEGTLSHSITIIDALDGEQIIFNVDNVNEEEMYLNQDLDGFEEDDGVWLEFQGKQYFSFDRDKNGITSNTTNQRKRNTSLTNKRKLMNSLKQK